MRAGCRHGPGVQDWFTGSTALTGLGAARAPQADSFLWNAPARLTGSSPRTAALIVSTLDNFVISFSVSCQVACVLIGQREGERGSEKSLLLLRFLGTGTHVPGVICKLQGPGLEHGWPCRNLVPSPTTPPAGPSLFVFLTNCHEFVLALGIVRHFPIHLLQLAAVLNMASQWAARRLRVELCPLPWASAVPGVQRVLGAGYSPSYSPHALL